MMSRALRLRHDHAAGGIKRQMQLSSFPARLGAMLRLQPLTSPVDLQRGTVINTCNGPGSTEVGWITGSVSARRLTVLWSGAEIIRPIRDSTDDVKPSVRRTASVNAVRSIRLVGMAASMHPNLPARSSGLPAFQRYILDPQRQAASPAQARFVGRPILHLERHLRDVVTAGGVVFARHRDNQNQKGEAILSSPLDRPCAPTP
jgi:hypothetical protein